MIQRRPKSKGDSEKGPKKAGRGYIRDRRHLTKREEVYCQLISSGLPMEQACQELNITIREASRWHSEHPMLEKRISELRGERFDQLSEAVLSKYLLLIEQLLAQIETKEQEGGTLTIKEMKDLHGLSTQVGLILQQHSFRLKEADKEKVTRGDAIVLDINEPTLMELAEKIKSPEVRDYNEKVFVRWFKDIGTARQKRVLKQING